MFLREGISYLFPKFHVRHEGFLFHGPRSLDEGANTSSIYIIFADTTVVIFMLQDSPLYDVLSQIQPTSTMANATPDITQASPADIITYNLGASQFLTPSRRGRMQDRPLVENGQPPRSRSLAVFLNKVCRLAYHRLQLLCNTLTIPKDVVSLSKVCPE